MIPLILGAYRRMNSDHRAESSMFCVQRANNSTAPTSLTGKIGCPGSGDIWAAL